MSSLMSERDEIIVRLIHAHGRVHARLLSDRAGPDAPTGRRLTQILDGLRTRGWIDVASGRTSDVRWALTDDGRPYMSSTERLPSRPQPARYSRRSAPC